MILPSRRELLAGAAASALLPRLALPQGFSFGGPTPVVFNDGDVYPYGELNIQPSAFYDAATTTEWYFWQGWKPVAGVYQQVIEVSTRNRTTGVWIGPTICGTATLSHDGHGVPTACKFGNFTYVCYGSHSSLLQQSVTTNANDPTAWTALPAIDNETVGGFTFVRPYYISPNLWLMYAGNLQEILYVKRGVLTGNVPAFDPGIGVVFGFDGVTGGWINPGDAFLIGTEIYFTWSWSSVAGGAEQDIYIGRYDTATGSLKNFDGTHTVIAANLPITKVGAPSEMVQFFRVVDQATGGTFGASPAFNRDSGGNFHLVYPDGANSGGGPTRLLHRTYSGGVWSAATLIYTYTSTEPDNIGATIGVNGTGIAVYYPDSAKNASLGQGNMLMSTRTSGGVWAGPFAVKNFETWGYYSNDVVQDHPDGLMIFTEASILNFTGAEVIAGNLRGYAFSPTAGFVGRRLDPVSVLDGSSATTKSANLDIVDAFTVTCNSALAAGNIVRSSTSHSNGKYYLEVMCLGGAGDVLGFGFINSSQSVSGKFMGDAGGNSIGWYPISSGAVYWSGSQRGNNGLLGLNVWGGIALDLVNLKLWVRGANGQWNANSAANNPATNLGGIDLSTFAVPAPLYFGIDAETLVSSAKVNFGGLPYFFTPPSGFVNW